MSNTKILKRLFNVKIVKTAVIFFNLTLCKYLFDAMSLTVTYFMHISEVMQVVDSTSVFEGKQKCHLNVQEKFSIE